MIAEFRGAGKTSKGNGKKPPKRNFLMERTEKFRAMGQQALAHAPGSTG
jgi:hypothetical protein